MTMQISETTNPAKALLISGCNFFWFLLNCFIGGYSEHLLIVAAQAQSRLKRGTTQVAHSRRALKASVHKFNPKALQVHPTGMSRTPCARSSHLFSMHSLASLLELKSF